MKIEIEVTSHKKLSLDHLSPDPQKIYPRVTISAKYMGFFSSRSLKTREKYISFAQLVLLSLYIFWGKHNCEFYHPKLKSKVNFPQKIYKLSKTNIFFSRFEGTRGEKNQIFRTLVKSGPQFQWQLISSLLFYGTNFGNLHLRSVQYMDLNFWA